MHLRNILLAIGVLALLAGSSLALLWVTQRPAIVAAPSAPEPAAQAPAQAPPQARSTILVAAHPIPSGTLLRAEDVTWKEVPAAEAKPDSIKREPDAEKKYLGALAEKGFAAGEPVLGSGLIKPSDRGFLAALLKPGSRAVSIAVDAPQSASGLLLPGNQVDIILTQTFGEDSDPARKSVGETILRNLRVIAVDQRLGAEALPDAAKSEPAGSIPKTITLEASEREAEALMVASRLGRLEVALRALGRDVAESENRTAIVSLWASDVSPALKTIRRAPVAPVARAAPAAPAPRPRQPIEVMHGSKIETR
jgi:pilus assembly protein CpaB